MKKARGQTINYIIQSGFQERTPDAVFGDLSRHENSYKGSDKKQFIDFINSYRSFHDAFDTLTIHKFLLDKVEFAERFVIR